MLPLGKPRAVPIYDQDVETSFGETIGAQFEQAKTELPTVAAYRYYKGLGRADDQISFDEARAKVADAGLEGQLEISSLNTPSASAVDLLIERKQDELRRLDILQRSQKDVFTQGALFGTSLLTGFLDPVNVGLAFVPVAGGLKWAQAAKQSASALTRFGGRAAIGAVEGAAGAAIIEPLIYASKAQEQAEYGLMDSFLNVAFGTVFGGALHSSVGAGGDIYRAVRNIDQPWHRTAGAVASPKSIDDVDGVAAMVDDVPRLRPDRGEAQRTADALTMPEAEAVYRAGIGQMMDGRPIDIEDLVAHYAEKTSDGIAVRDLDPARIEEIEADINGLVAVEQSRAQAAMTADPARAADIAAQSAQRVELMKQAAEAKSTGKALTPEQKEAVRQGAVARAIDDRLPVPDRFTPDDMKREASVQRGKYAQKQLDRRRNILAKEQADKELAANEMGETKATEVPTSTMTEEIQRLETEIGDIEKLVGKELEALGAFGDDASIKAADDLLAKADRWGKIAETAQLCVMRGG